MGYSIDITKISIREYRELLQNQNLLPGRRILLENIEERLHIIDDSGMTNVYELKKTLSTPTKMKSFSKKTGLSEEYLIILRRELGTLEQKPVVIKDFPNINQEIIEELEIQGIKTSKDFFEVGLYNDNNDKSFNMLFSLCDLVRINGIGVAAARTFYEAGYSSATDVANSNAEDILKRVNEVNRAKKYYKARLWVKDMQFCIDFAKLLTRLEN